MVTDALQQLAGVGPNFEFRLLPALHHHRGHAQ